METESVDMQTTSMETSLIQNSDNEKSKISMFRAVVFLTNVITGTGALTIPYCFRTGVGTNSIVLIFIALISYLSVVLLIDTSKKSGTSDYDLLMGASFSNKKLKIIPQLTTFITLFGIIIVYIQFVCSLFQSVFDEINGVPNLLYKRWFLIPIAIGCVTLPITMLKSIGALSYVSIFSIAMSLIYVVHGIYIFFSQDKFDPDNRLVIFSTNSIFIPSLATQCSSFTCQPFVFSTLLQMKNCTISRQYKAMFFAILTSSLLYYIGGIFPYLTFFDDIKDAMVISYFKKGNVFTIIVKGLFTLLTMLSCPNVVFFCRKSLNDMIFGTEPTTLRWIIMGFIIIVVTASIAITVKSISTLFGFIGGLACPVMAYILPSTYYLRICHGDSIPKTNGAYTLLVIGFLFIVVCMYNNIKNLI